MRSGHSSIRRRLPILVSALIALVLVTFLWAAYREVRSTLLGTGGSRAQSAADQLASLFAQSAQQRQTELRRVGDHAAVRRYLETPAPEAERDARQILATLQGRQTIQLWDQNGGLLLTVTPPPASGSDRAEPALPDGSAPSTVGPTPFRVFGDIVVSEAVAEIQREPSPDPTPGRLGYLVVRRPLAAAGTSNVLNRLVGSGAVVEIGNKIGGVWTDFSKPVPAPAVDTTRAGVARYQTPGGEDRVGAIADIPGTPWALWVEFPQALVLAPARGFLVRMTGVALLVIAIAIVMVSTLSARMTTPLHELTDVAEAMASGDYSKRVSATRRDEIGRLGDAFNTMAEHVNDVHHRLEAQIEERTGALEALRLSEARQRAIVEVAFDSFITIDANGKVIEFNPAAERMFGYTRHDAIGRELADLIVPPAFRSAHRRGLERYRTTHEGPVIGTLVEIMAMRADGSQFPVELAITALPGDGPPTFTGVVRDITRRKIAEREQSRLAAIIESSQDAIVSRSTDGTILTWNPGAARLYGYEAADVVGRSVSLILPEDRRDELPAILDKINRGVSVDALETTHRRRDGTVIDVSVTVSPVRDASGEVIGASSIARDITERKKTDEQLRTLSQELEQRVVARTAELAAVNRELETFTYSVAHDLRAPLRHIDGFARLLVEAQPEGLSDDGRHYLAQIRDSATQMGQLIEDLLNLARVGRRELAWQVTGLASVVDAVVAELKRANPERCIEWKIHPLPFVECDPGLMKQVFANLLSNAVKFTRPRNPAVIEVGTETHEGQAAIVVRDNGVGFSMRYANKLFGVFQRLHRAEDFEGTGVGLATVQRIVHKHGGRIWADAAIEKGATFFLTLAAPTLRTTETVSHEGDRREGR